MADLKGFAIKSFTVLWAPETKGGSKLSFDYTYDGGAGTAHGICCESVDQVMTSVKQMLNGEWPSA